MDIYNYLNYRQYIKDHILELPKGGRGVRSAMAHAVNCKTGYLTQVLNGSADFNLEQALKLSQFLEHAEDESRYFLLLVNFSRAGNKALKDFLRKQIRELQNKSLQLKKRLNIHTPISEADLARYFSSLENSLVHILTTIPLFQTRSAMLDKLKIPPRRLEKILDFLMELGFVREEGSKYICTNQRLHLPDDSPLIAVKHSLWRLQSIKALQTVGETDLHYSSVVSISREDQLRIKQSLVSEIESCKKVIADSEAEIPCGLCFDFFELT